MCSRPGSIRDVRPDRVAPTHELAITENVIAAVTERIGSEQAVRVQFGSATSRGSRRRALRHRSRARLSLTQVHAAVIPGTHRRNVRMLAILRSGSPQSIATHQAKGAQA